MKEQTPAVNTPDLIVMLLEHEIKISKLIYSLYTIHVVAESYFSYMGVTILELIGFSENQKEEVLNKVYDSFMIGLIAIDIFKEPTTVKELASKLYEILLKEKQLRNSSDNLN